MSAEDLLTPSSAAEVVIRQERPLPLDRPDQLASEIASHLSNDVSGLTTKLGLKPITDLTLEIQSHMDNNTSHLISKLGLQPSDYSAEISTSGLTISIHGQVKATVRCDGTVQVERFDQLVCQAPNVEVASTVVKELITDDSPSKRKIVEVQQEPVQAKKSPKLAIIEQEEEEPAVPTPLLNLE